MRLSRWGRSPYETIQDIEAEAQALGGFVDIVAPGADAEIVVIHSKIAFGESQARQTPSVRLIITTTSGTDHIDLDYFRNLGVSVARLPEARRDAVVDATVGMLIWGLRRRGSLVRRGNDGEWARGELSQLGPIGLNGSRIGLVGLGVIGRQVGHILHALGATVLGCDPKGLPEHVELSNVDEMLGTCDAISLHCDLHPGSRRILSASRLAKAREGIVVVNTARGDLVDVDAAIQLTLQGHLGGLALDVFPVEPFPEMALMNKHPRLLFTPHSAGYHTTLASKIQAGLCSAVKAFVDAETVPYLV